MNTEPTIKVKTNSLFEYLNKNPYFFGIIDEYIIKQMLYLIEQWYVENIIDLCTWNNDESYRKDISEHIEKVKLSYYTNMVKDLVYGNPQEDMKLKHKFLKIKFE